MLRWKSHYVKSPPTPRHIPPTSNPRQFLPKVPSISILIRPIYPNKCPLKNCQPHFWTYRKQRNELQFPLSCLQPFYPTSLEHPPEEPTKPKNNRSKCWQPHRDHITPVVIKSIFVSCKKLYQPTHLNRIPFFFFDIRLDHIPDRSLLSLLFNPLTFQEMILIFIDERPRPVSYWHFLAWQTRSQNSKNSTSFSAPDCPLIPPSPVFSKHFLLVSVVFSSPLRIRKIL